MRSRFQYKLDDGRTVEVFAGRMVGKWYWHVLSRGGKITSDGGQAFASKYNAKRAAFRNLKLPIPKG